MRAVGMPYGNFGFARTILIPTASCYAIAVVFCIAVLWMKGGTVKDAGWTWRIQNGRTIVASVDPKGPAAALMPDSDIVAIDGDSRVSRAGPRPWLQTVPPGASYRLIWTNHDAVRHESEFRMGAHASRRDLEMGISDLLLSLSFAAAGFIVWAAKPRDLVARPCSVASLLTAFYLLGSAIGPVSPQLEGVPLVVYLALKSIFPFYMTAGCAFFARFPTGETPRKPWRVGFQALLWLGIAGWIITIPRRFFPNMGLEWRMQILSGLDLNLRPELGGVALKHGYVALCALYIFGVAIYNYRRLNNEAMRLRVRWAVLGATVGIVPGIAYSFSLAIADAMHLVSPAGLRGMVSVYSLSTLALVAMPATLIYAILANRLMGIKVAISTGFQLLVARRVFQGITLLPVIPVVFYLWATVASR